MYDFDVADLIVSLLLTWVIGLTPPLVFRYLIIGKPLSKGRTIFICGFFAIVNLTVFIAMVSFWILRKESKGVKK